MTCKGCEFFFNPDELLSHLYLNLCSGKQSLNIHDNVDNNLEYDIEPQTEDGSDNAYLSENNLVNDSNCELISEIDIVEHKLEPISGEDNDTDIEQENDNDQHATTQQNDHDNDIEQENDNDKDSDAPSQQNDHDNDIEQEIVDADFILTNVSLEEAIAFFSS